MHTAQRLNIPIISADSRQIYRHIPIGTACPSTEDRKAVPHFFIEELELDSYYSASRFEEEALRVIDGVFKNSDYALMCGGSMMYVDAVTKGLDELPTVTQEIRAEIAGMFRNNGLDHMLDLLRQLDPTYYLKVDKSNYKRIIHALEISLQTGRPYSSFLTGQPKQRGFNIATFAIAHSREELFRRINDRVDEMIIAGLEQEARSVYHLRHLNSLNTVGYKELFDMFDGKIERPEAIEKIKRNTRVYAKKQLTWLKKDDNVTWLSPEPVDFMFDRLLAYLKN